MLEQRSGESQEALLRLEKGSGSPNAQLHDAAQILGIDLGLCASHPETHRNSWVQEEPFPKAEWGFRWLLKKLKNEKSYRVEPTSFLLLRQLLDMIAAKSLAIQIKDHKFLSILYDTVADLETDIFATMRSGQSILNHDSDSSQTVLSPQQGRVAQGTKRKRVVAESEEEDANEPPPNPASCLLAFIRALDCLYGVLLLAQRTLNTDDSAHSHLKLALKGPPATVAGLLGKSFRVAAVAVTEFSQAGKTTDLQHLLYVFPAMLDLWESRSDSEDDANNKSSNECFAQSCFAHALRLQLCLRAIRLDTDERGHLLLAVERLVALHVLLPARAAFLYRGGQGIDYTQDEPNWNAVEPVTNTFRLIIRENHLSHASQDSSNKAVDSSWRAIELLPELYDNAVRAVPRDSFRRQRKEAAWLETLFVAVAELAYSTAKEDDPHTFYTKFILVLEDLLQVALDRNVGLSLHTVLTHSGYTGLLKPVHEKVQWKITALLINLGVDIFLPNSGLPDTRELLNALLDKIMHQWRNGFHEDSNSYNVIKFEILIPLLKGFAAARDLPTFTQVWCGQLTIIEKARLRNDKLPLFTVWEDDDLCDAYSEAVRTSLTGSHAEGHIHTTAIDTKAGNGQISGSAQSYARFVIMEAMSRSQISISADSEKALTELLHTVTDTLHSGRELHWRWRLWRFLRNLLQVQSQSGGGFLIREIQSLMTIAAKTIRRKHGNLEKPMLSRLESWEAYRFALEAVKEYPSDDRRTMFTSIFEITSNFVASISPAEAQESVKSPWDGRVNTLETPRTLALAYLLAVIQVPKAWALIPSESRKRLFRQLLSLAAAQYRSSSLPLEAASDDARFLQAWASVICHEYLLGVPSIVPDLVSLLNHGIENDTPNRRLYVVSMQRIPAALITRGLRTTIMNTLHGVALQQDSPPDVTVGLLTMLAKLAAMPKSDATLTSDWEPIWALARALNLEGRDVDLEIMKTFRILHRAIIAKLLVLNEDDRIEMFANLFARVSKQASKMRQVDRDSMACFLLRVSLSELWVHRKQLSKAFSEEELAACRERVFGLVLSDMKSVKDHCKKQKLEETINLIKTIDALEDFEDLATNNIEVEKFLTKIEKYMQMSVDSAPSRLIRRRLLATNGPETKPVLQCAETLTLQSLYAEDQQLFIRATTERFRSMTPEKIGQAISEIRALGLTNDSVSSYRLLVLYLAVISLPPVEDKESQVAFELSQLATVLSGAIVRSTSIDQFCFSAECLALLLRVHPRCLTQSNIDGILTAIGACASKDGPRLSSSYAPTLFTRLCRLVGLILGLQRLKIGGRFHVTVDTMVQLQRCLFARSRKRSRSAKSQATINQPPWLDPLQPPHASHYTRLLTSLCDPTVSAVLRPQPGASREGLTDETKKAKRIAGQYLQYVIVEYAKNSLRGSLRPEVKTALMPGLYAALDVMSKESLHAMSGAMDSSNRAVFKTLYDDYVKFGQWNKA